VLAVALQSPALGASLLRIGGLSSFAHALKVAQRSDGYLAVVRALSLPVARGPWPAELIAANRMVSFVPVGNETVNLVPAVVFHWFFFLPSCVMYR